MSASCCGQTAETHSRDGFRRVLWAVLAINAGMFAVEVVAGLAAGSASLQADALDFLGDAGNYVISLAVVGMALRYRAMASFAKGATMGLFGLWVIGVTAWHAWHGTVPCRWPSPWARWVPPLDSRATPCAASSRAKSTIPDLSETESRARRTFMAAAS